MTVFPVLVFKETKALIAFQTTMTTERCTVMEVSQPPLDWFDSLALWQENKSKSQLKRGTDFLKYSETFKM